MADSNNCCHEQFGIIDMDESDHASGTPVPHNKSSESRQVLDVSAAGEALKRLSQTSQAVDAMLRTSTVLYERHMKDMCYPCVFWPKGWCLKKNDCLFCHYEHAELPKKKKMKRPDRKTRQLIRQQNQDQSAPSSSSAGM